MEHAYGLDIPTSLEESCHPTRLAVLVYDMQVGIVRQARSTRGLLPLPFQTDAALTDAL